MNDLQDVEPGRRAAVTLDSIARADRDHQRQHRRPAALTAREALAAVQFECLLVAVASSNIVRGVDLTEEDHQRLILATSRIQRIAQEVGT